MTSRPGKALRRIGAIFRRHFYLLSSSWPRVVDLVYWPTVQMILWGMITLYLATQSSVIAQAGGIFLSAVLLWDTLFRGQLGVSTAFLEEMYARHLGHLFVSPLRPHELVIAMFGISLARVVIGVGGASLLAIPLLDFWVGSSLGWSFVAFFAIQIMFGWAIAMIVSGLVLRLGLGAESLAWASIFLIQPFSGVYYPIETLPGWLQPVAWSLPSAAVFEGMRAVILESRFDLGLLRWGSLMLALWTAIAVLVFSRLFAAARRQGLLLQIGE